METKKYVDIITGYSCNMNCDFCMGCSSRRDKNYSFSSIRSSIIKLKKEGYGSLCFNGGEPTIRQSLIDMIKFAGYIGFEEIKLQTNGIMLAREDYLKKLLEAGISSIGITICSVEKAKYEKMTSLGGCFDLILRALENIKKMQITTEIDIVITKLNFNDLKNIFDFLRYYGIKKFNFKFPGIAGNSKINAKTVIPKIDDICPQLKKCLDICKEDPDLECTVQYMPYCLLEGYEEFMLDLENTRLTIIEGEHSFEFNESFKNTHIKIPNCENCKHLNSCPGIDKEYIKIHGMPKLKQIDR
ncbi:MAG: radical SAM protein [Nanoarchaeota archaeon]|nr:radical SAM protein [Nanoarchaeota archaeon]